jgi:hypothetical protein
MSKAYNAYLVQPYRSVEDMFESEPEPWGASLEHSDLNSAVSEAEELGGIHGGAVVFSVVGDMQTGMYSSYKVVRTFGELPDADLAG